jgi:hypothetical protein
MKWFVAILLLTLSVDSVTAQNPNPVSVSSANTVNIYVGQQTSSSAITQSDLKAISDLIRALSIKFNGLDARLKVVEAKLVPPVPVPPPSPKK